MSSQNEHGICGTVHCRAGHVVALAGEAGRRLERENGVDFAAAQIYKASSAIEVSCTRFFDRNKDAMIDIEYCAKIEENEV